MTQSRKVMVTAIHDEAKRLGVPIDAKRFAFACSESACVVNTAIRARQPLTEDQLKEGTDLLFVHLTFPRGAAEVNSKTRLVSGYYIVRAVSLGKRGNGRALLLKPNRREVLGVPMIVTPNRAHGGKVAAAQAVRPVSGSIDPCGVMVDVHVRKFHVTIHIRWC